MQGIRTPPAQPENRWTYRSHRNLTKTWFESRSPFRERTEKAIAELQQASLENNRHQPSPKTSWKETTELCRKCLKIHPIAHAQPQKQPFGHGLPPVENPLFTVRELPLPAAPPDIPRPSL